MPAISLVVCLHRERDLLKRLLEKTSGCYDDLVVIHDGPENDEAKTPAPPVAIDFSRLESSAPWPAGYRELTSNAQPGTVQELVQHYRGRFFEGPRAFQQEPHWPFAFHVA